MGLWASPMQHLHPVTDAAPSLLEETLALVVARDQPWALAFSSKLASKDSPSAPGLSPLLHLLTLERWSPSPIS